MKLKKLLSAAFLTCFGFATQLSAAIVQVQYTGIVASGYDTTGVFGAANSSLNGLAYTANYTFETTNGNTYNDLYTGQAYGGLLYSNLSPALSSSFTVNGTTVAISGNRFGYIYGHNNGNNFSQVYHESQELVDTASMYRFAMSQNYIYNNSNTLPASITDPFSYTVTGGDSASGYFQFYENEYSVGVTQNAYAYLAPDHITIGAPIPEPETYAMLLAGLGLLGFAARRRKLKEASTA